MLIPSARRNFHAALRDVEHDKAEIRASAVHDLASHTAEHADEVVPALRRALDDEHANVRIAAAVALADAAAQTDTCNTALPELLSALDDGHESVREMVLSALGEIGDASASGPIAAFLTDESAPLRFQAVLAFARVCPEHDKAVQALLDATHDDDPLVCHIALRMGEELGDEDAEVDPRIVARAGELLEHDSGEVRVVSAVILARVGRSDGDDILVGVANRTESTSETGDEAGALELCGERQLSRAMKGLERRAFGRVGLIRNDPLAWHARIALATLGHARAQEWILSQLRSWNRERRTMAASAAGKARLDLARDLLTAMQDRPDRADPQTVAEALAAIDAS